MLTFLLPQDRTRPARYLRPSDRTNVSGFTLIEVLIAVVIIAFGLLGIGAFQSKVSMGELESFQRSQAIMLLNDMTERMYANPNNAASYVTTGAIGTGDTAPANCTTLAVGAARDLCEWSNNLKGAAETSGNAKVGGMIGGRGCITQMQAPDPSAGVCTPGVYNVSVAWQGLYKTGAPAITCAQGSYGTDDTLRRVISAQVTIGLPSCS